MKRKKYLALALTAAMTLSAVLTACGSSASETADASSEETAAAESEATAESGEAAAEEDGSAETSETATAADVDLSGTEFNLYTWDAMFPQEVLDGFEAKTGVKINYSNFDYDEDMLAKLEETEGGDYDFVIADDYILELIREEGLAQKLDTTRLANWGNINPVFQGQFYDPDDEYTVPYGAGIPLIVYDPALVDIEITSYADLWDSSLADNLALTGNYRVIDGITMMMLGYSMNDEDLDHIQEAGDKLLELAPNVRVINDTNTQDFLISGEVGAAFLYTSQVSMALTARPDLQVVYPEEGLGFGIMAGFIPSQAPNADAAYAFIDYLLDPEVSAQCFEFIGYYCTNKAAEAYISDEMKEMIVLPEDAAEGQIVQNVSQEAEDKYSEIWNEFKKACGQ
ncbi:MAG: spermidine/putrescine ABC transporter substrate-binding protein [Eubacteriales bacterium]|nr:spermidine/putrescine ABC transporter substrate-binding protein [Eubacteriales bacterium]